MYAEAYGASEPVQELIPAMLASFLEGDKAFVLRRRKSETLVTATRLESAIGEPISVPEAVPVSAARGSTNRSGDVEFAKVGSSTLFLVESLRGVIRSRR
jgi:hypothetical protein